MKSRTWWNVWILVSNLLQTAVVKFISLCFSSPVILTLSMYCCTGSFVLLCHSEQFQFIPALSQLIFFTHTLQISREISVWGSFCQTSLEILWKSQPPGLVPYFECLCLAMAQTEHICQLSQDINIHIVSHPLQLAFKPWEYQKDASEHVKGYYFLL